MTLGLRMHVAPPLQAAPGELTQLAYRLGDQARALGFRIVRIETSRDANSRSQYVRLRDPLGAVWLVRVSDHPQRAGSAHHERPHLDVISGVAGEQAARDWLDAVASGLVLWTDPMVGVRGPRLRRRR